MPITPVAIYPLKETTMYIQCLGCLETFEITAPFNVQPGSIYSCPTCPESEPHAASFEVYDLNTLRPENTNYKILMEKDLDSPPPPE